MLTTRLRRVGGSVMLALPPAFVESLGIKVGSSVVIEINGHSLLIRPSRPRYDEAELLAKCDPTIPWSAEDREWLDARPAGLETI
jgi:antitoxin ChpS